jgi:hypothetical protein
MRTFYKTLVLGVFLAALAVASPTFAQDVCADLPANQALYDQYINNYKGTLEQKKTAVKAGKEYIEKYGACEAFAQQVDYLKKAVPKKEEEVKNEEMAIAQKARYERFNTALKAKNTPEIFASGEDILKYEPDFLDLIITLATIGLDEAAVKQSDTFNGKTIDYAKSAIKKIESGVTSKKYGLEGYDYDTKDNTLGWMNYTIGYIEYYRQKNKESGLTDLYKATQYNSETKDRDFIYALIGDKYIEKADALNKEIVIIIDKEKKETFESKSKLAMSKGYADRAIEAYAKAYEVAKANMNKEKDAAKKAKMKEYTDNLYSTLKGLYKFRYETVENPIPDTDLVTKLNSHIASVTSKPLTNPSTEVTPVDPPSEDEKTTDSTTSSTTTTTTPAAAKTPAPTMTKPVTKTTTNGAAVKTEADKTNNKPKRKR